jgi:hypothetical protein
VRPRILALVAAIATAGAGLPAAADLGPLGTSSGTDVAATAGGLLAVARNAAPVVLTGSQIADWAAPAAEGLAKPQPSGANSDNPIGDEVRTAHNGTLVVPPTPPGVTEVKPVQVAAFAWNGQWWRPIRVQVDQRFPYFLANGRSDFGFYSGTDEELTYEWAPDRHSIGEESWKAMFGECESRFASGVDEVKKAIDEGWLSLGPQESAADYLTSMRDPQPLFDTDDELSFLAGDAGLKAPSGAPPPTGSIDGQTIRIVDPLRPTVDRYVYLFTKPGGEKFGAADGYAQLTRDPMSRRWVDKYSFDDADPTKIGTSNGGYGPNLPGTVCDTSPENLQRFGLTDPAAPRPSTDRAPHDSFTVTTPTYRLHATGRWLIQDLRVRRPGVAPSADPETRFGPNVIARWKGRAFQQNPDSDVSLVGFEDEQVNWELNSALLGWRQGPVRAIREIWGADSGTNVTKTEFYYRDADAYAYHVRVHPIPPDGLYTDWSYRPGVATTYYNLVQQDGVPVDGVPDTSGNEIDQTPGVEGTPQDALGPRNAYINSCDPKFTICSAIDNPEEIAGDGFGLVYEFELTGPTGAAGNAAVVPYYRDDACFDDGTGDAPVQRPWPGESSTDDRVRQGYVDYWAARGMPVTGNLDADYAQLECHPEKAGDPSQPPWKVMPFSGAIGQHGVHFFATQDSDNAFGPKNVDEIDGQQWRFSVPMDAPTNVLSAYGANVSSKLVAVVTPLPLA